MSPTVKRVLIAGPIVVALVVVLVLAFRPQPVPVDLGTVTAGPMRVVVRDDGVTRVRDVYVVSAPVAGRLLRLEGEVGDAVLAGETVIGRIQPSDPSFLDVRSRAGAEADVKAAEAALALSRASVEQVRAELEFASAERDRALKLADRGNISMSALDRSQMEVRTLTASLRTAEADVRLREANLQAARSRLITPDAAPETDADAASTRCCVDIRAPIDGVLLRVLQESETVIASGTPVVELGDPRNLEIVTDLLSTDAVGVRPGAEVSIEQWGGAPLPGLVRRVEPYGFTKVSALGVDEQRVNVVIDIDAAQADWLTLGHGYRVETAITVWQRDEAVQVPLGAVFRQGSGWAVFVVEDGVARQRMVEIGRRNDDVAELLTGLEPGETVVLHPSDRVADDVVVVSRDG